MPKRAFDELNVVGGSILSEKRTLAWKVCNFADLQHKRGDRVKETGILPCHGLLWGLYLYPRGDNKSSQDAEFCSMYLALESEGEAKAKYTIRVGCHSYSSQNKQSFVSGTSTNNWGWTNFCKRDYLLARLDEGDLLVEIDIERHLDKVQPLLPRDTLSHDMLRMLESGAGSDVSFLVGGKLFPAHSGILTMRAPILAELAEDAASGTNVPLDGIDEVIFNALLRNVYAGEIPADELMEDKARELLDAADRFGSTSLKLHAESKLVAAGVTTETAADLILLADAKNCALLKEKALNYFKANTYAVMQSLGWENVKKSASLLSEIMETLVPGGVHVGGSDSFDYMSVTNLRRELQEKELSEDGTREMLVQRLKDYCSSKAKGSRRKRMLTELE